MYRIAILISIIIVICGCDKKLSVSEPDPPPPAGEFNIKSTPAGYDIYLDGRITGEQTPAHFKFMEERNYSISLKHPWYIDTTISYDVVEANSEVNLDCSKHDKFSGNIICRTYPTGAKIFLDDSLLAEKTHFTIENINPGNHEIRFELFGHRSETRFPLVKSNDTTICTANLVDTTIWLIYNTATSSIPTNDLSSIFPEISNNKNLIWVGSTENGFYSFDGIKWDVINKDVVSMPTMYIEKIKVDPFGNKWAASIYKLYRYDNSGSFSIIASRINKYYDVDFLFERSYSDFRFNTFYATERGLIRENKDEEITYLPGNAPIPRSDIYHLDSYNDKILIGGENWIAVLRLTEEGDEWTVIRDIPTTNTGGAHSKKIGCVKIHSNHYTTKIAAGFNEMGVYVIHNLEHKTDEWYEIPSHITAVEIEGESFWVTTWDGLYKLERGSITEHYTTENSRIPTNLLTGIYINGSSTIWLTSVKGLIRFNRNAHSGN